MVSERYPFALKEESSFDVMLDSACDRLQEAHIQYSLRRIKEMDEVLARLEEEIDEFIGKYKS